ncbi:hypothetical protein [Actinoplanes solisilvae]|uniref:hypothetical protein n=1 Tax=Actinoplanes solisilvae TaxID=2486853 RepID=UPI000FDB16D7|nr:hypothetical protein [Actinoplanes solisilvae]
MTSMPESITNGDQINDNTEVIEVADGHVVHMCCGKLDDAAHKNFCPNWPGDGGFAERFLDEMRAAHAARTPEQVQDDLAERAMSTLVGLGMVDPEAGEALVSLWRRRDRFSAAELEAITVAASAPVPTVRMADGTARRAGYADGLVEGYARARGFTARMRD